MLSIWSENSKLPSFDPLKGNVKTDVLIIGGGMAGILCAYFLKNAGVNYILAEQNTICSGITKNTTAKITSQHGLIYQKIIREFGTETAKMYLDANEKAVSKFRQMCIGNKHSDNAPQIDCDFKNKPSFIYSTGNQYKIEKELTALSGLGYKAEYENRLPLPFHVSAAVKFKNQAQFNPLRFLQHISKGLNIFEHTEVKELIGETAVTDMGKIYADKIIVAAHFPFINKHGGYFLKMYQHRSYVTALKNAANLSGMYMDESEKGFSFRNCGDMLLVGGGAHKTGKHGGGLKYLEHASKEFYPNSEIKYEWAAQDCMTLDGIPYIGKYSSHTDKLFTATGFNKWGMTSSMIAAEILTDMILEKDNEYAKIFSPSRTVLRPQLLINGFNAAVNLLKPSANRCPHMGCALKWNEEEQSWDCPCHGSRFKKNGKLLNNPATGNLKTKKRRH